MPVYKFVFDLLTNRAEFHFVSVSGQPSQQIQRTAAGIYEIEIACAGDADACRLLTVIKTGLELGSLKSLLKQPDGVQRPKDLDFGKVAYEGYFKACEGKSLISGTPLPMWEGQVKEIQNAWREAGANVLRYSLPEEAAG
jgi:hypothetical protein